MKKKYFKQHIIVSIVFTLFFLFMEKELKSSKSKQDTIVNWAFEDNTPDDGWNFSQTWQKNRDRIGRISADKNVTVSKKEFYKGKISLQININHYQKGYCGCSIYTRPDNTGMPPRSSQEANQGKDISHCDTLEFWVKGTGEIKVKNIKIELSDSNNLYTDKRFLIDYIKPNKEWQKVNIPLDEFSWDSGINKKIIKSISFFIDKEDPFYGKYTLYIDNIRFIKKGITVRKRFKLVFDDDSLSDGAWNFSGARVGKGTFIETSSYYGNIPISIDEKYKGYSSIKISVYQNRFGWGYVWFTGNCEGKGVPPKNWDDYNTPKDISLYNMIQFWIKGEGTCGGKLELSDIDNNPTGKIDITKYVDITEQWKKVVIPFDDIYWQNFDTTLFKDIKFIIESEHPPGEFTIYIDNLEFIEYAYGDVDLNIKQEENEVIIDLNKEYNQLFNEDYEITPKGQKILNAIISVIEQESYKRIIIIVGIFKKQKEKKDKILSKKQAKAIYSYFIDNGIDKKRISSSEKMKKNVETGILIIR